jgi:hypothetical protein
MERDVIEIVIKGEGETAIALFDRSGRALLRKRWRASGDARIEVRSRLPLLLQTTKGAAPVIPVIVYTGREQKVTFNETEAKSFTEERVRSLKWPKTAFEKISRAAAELGETEGRRFPNTLQVTSGKR